MFNKDLIISASESRKESEKTQLFKELERERLINETFKKCLDIEKNELVNTINQAIKKGTTVEVCVIRNKYVELTDLEPNRLNKFYDELIKDFVEKDYEFERIVNSYNEIKFKISW